MPPTSPSTRSASRSCSSFTTSWRSTRATRSSTTPTGRSRKRSASEPPPNDSSASCPRDQGDELHGCWLEFELGTTAEARFARALDRLQPLLLNHASAGQAWREHGITAAQVRAVNSTIGDGSAALWELAQHVIDDAVMRGWLARDRPLGSTIAFVSSRGGPRWVQGWPRRGALGRWVRAFDDTVDRWVERLSRPQPGPALLRAVERRRPRAALDRARRVACGPRAAIRRSRCGSPPCSAWSRP